MKKVTGIFSERMDRYSRIIDDRYSVRLKGRKKGPERVRSRGGNEDGDDQSVDTESRLACSMAEPDRISANTGIRICTGLLLISVFYLFQFSSYVFFDFPCLGH